jgi:hypothetical protein
MAGWHKAENFSSATTSAAIRKYNRRVEHVDATPALDPIQSAPGKLAKDRRCKSSTG